MILPYNAQKQILTKWCWAAVASSISMCRNPDSVFTQQTIATGVLKQDCSDVSSTNIPDGVNIIEELSVALTVSGDFRDQTLRTLTLQEVITEIDNKSPIGCQIKWENLDMAHFVCIFGYDDNTLDLHIGDPEQPQVFIISFDDFVFSYRGGEWKATVYTKPTPQS